MIVIHTPRIYWGVETEPADTSFFTGSWLMEDMLPYRESTKAVRIRVSHRHWLHIGFYRYRREALHTGLSYRPSDIGRWGKDAAQEEPSEGDDPGQEQSVRSTEPGRSGDGAGVEPVPVE